MDMQLIIGSSSVYHRLFSSVIGPLFLRLFNQVENSFPATPYIRTKAERLGVTKSACTFFQGTSSAHWGRRHWLSDAAAPRLS
jgi:hypothetical protein